MADEERSMARLASETRSLDRDSLMAIQDHPRGHMVERIHRLHETAEERLAKLAQFALQEDEPLRYRILGMIHDSKARQWVSDRREGIYVGFFMFLRKIGGASAVLAVGAILEYVGFVGDASRAEQSPLALQTIRVLMSLAPLALLLASIAVATRYPITRQVHGQILAGLSVRREADGDPQTAG